MPYSWQHDHLSFCLYHGKKGGQGHSQGQEEPQRVTPVTGKTGCDLGPSRPTSPSPRSQAAGAVSSCPAHRPAPSKIQCQHGGDRSTWFSASFAVPVCYFLSQGQVHSWANVTVKADSALVHPFHPGLCGGTSQTQCWVFEKKRRKFRRANTFVAVESLSPVRLFATPWTVARQAPLSMGFSRQEYWSGLPFPIPNTNT